MNRDNPFQRFSWERDGNGNYVVTDRTTGQYVTAISRLGGRGRRFCIRESEETEINHYGQRIPKVYDKFGVIAFCEGHSASRKVDTHTREG